jgi:hypothetical protein
MLFPIVQGPVDEARPGIGFNIPDKSGVGVTLYNAAAAAKGQPFLVVPTVTADQEFTAGAPVTGEYSTVGQRMVVVAMDAYAAGTIGKYQISGICEVLIRDTASATAGHFIRVDNGETSFETTSGATQTVASVAMLVDAVTSAEGSGSPVLKTAILLGIPTLITA